MKSGSQDKKRVAFLELLHHHECIELPARALAHTGAVDVSLHLGQFVAERLGDVLGAAIIRQPFRERWLSLGGPARAATIPLELAEVSVNTAQVIAALERERPDVLFVNTIDSPYLAGLMAWLLSGRIGKVVYTVHATDVLFDGVRGQTLVKRSTGPALRAIYRRAAGLLLLGDYVKLPPDLQSIPTAVVNNRETAEGLSVEKGGPTTFVIPGSVDPSLRDYEAVFRATRRVLDADPGCIDRMKVHLLSRMDRTRVSPMVEQFDLEAVVETHDAFVSEEDFTRGMREGHFAIVPTHEGSAYGDYKISGPFGDAIAFGLPILIPEHYASGHTFGKNVIRYGNDGLHSVITDIMNGEHRSARVAAVALADRHSLSNTGETLLRLLDQI